MESNFRVIDINLFLNDIYLGFRSFVYSIEFVDIRVRDELHHVFRNQDRSFRD